MKLVDYIENYQEACARYGNIVRFYVLNSVVYAIGGRKKGICPARESDRYAEFKDIIEAAIEDLKDKPNGCWMYYPSIGKWLGVPISANELESIANYEPRARYLISFDTPVNGVMWL